jgi:hypothetical protein
MKACITNGERLPVEVPTGVTRESGEKGTWRMGRGENEKIERSAKIITVFCVKGQQTELKSFRFHCSPEFVAPTLLPSVQFIS